MKKLCLFTITAITFKSFLVNASHMEELGKDDKKSRLSFSRLFNKLPKLSKGKSSQNNLEENFDPKNEKLKVEEFNRLVDLKLKINWKEVLRQDISKMNDAEKVKNLSRVKLAIRNLNDQQRQKVQQFDELTHEYFDVDWNHVLKADLTKMNAEQKSEKVDMVKKHIRKLEEEAKAAEEARVAAEKARLAEEAKLVAQEIKQKAIISEAAKLAAQKGAEKIEKARLVKEALVAKEAELAGEFDKLTKSLGEYWKKILNADISTMNNSEKASRLGFVKNKIQEAVDKVKRDEAKKFDELTQLHNELDWNKILQINVSELDDSQKASKLLTVTSLLAKEFDNLIVFHSDIDFNKGLNKDISKMNVYGKASALSTVKSIVEEQLAFKKINETRAVRKFDLLISDYPEFNWDKMIDMEVSQMTSAEKIRELEFVESIIKDLLDARKRQADEKERLRKEQAEKEQAEKERAEKVRVEKELIERIKIAQQHVGEELVKKERLKKEQAEKELKESSGITQQPKKSFFSRFVS